MTSKTATATYLKWMYVLAITTSLLLGLRTHARSGAQNQTGPLFRLDNFAPGYTYTAFLNGEPIRWGGGPGLTTVSQYPLRQGSNYFRAVIDPSPIQSNTPSRVWMEAALKTDAGVISLEELRDRKPTESPLEWKFDFEVTNRLSGTNIAFEDLPENDALWSEESRALALGLAKLIAGRDARTIAKALSLSDAEKVKTSYPSWFFEASAQEVNVSCVTNVAELRTVRGKRWVLVCPSTSVGSGLGFGLVSVKKTGSNFAVGNDYFIFARVQGRWGLIAQEGGWTEVKLPMP